MIGEAQRPRVALRRARGFSTTSRPRTSRWSIAFGPVGAASPKRRSSSSKAWRCWAGRRLRSPPRISGSAPGEGHRQLGRAQQLRVRPGRSRAPTGACWPRRAGRPAGGGDAGEQQRAALGPPRQPVALDRLDPRRGAHERDVRAALVGLDQVREAVGDRRAQPRQLVARGQPQRAVGAARAAQGASQRGGASWSSAISHGRPSSTAANSSQQRALGVGAALARVVAPMEEVPRDRRDYDPRVTRHFLTGEEVTSEELRVTARPRRRAQGRPAHLPRAGGPQRRADLRAAVHAHAHLVRGRRDRAGRHADRAARGGDAALARRVGARHGAGAVALRARDLRAHRPARDARGAGRARLACPW